MQRLFKVAPAGISLERMQAALKKAAEALNQSRLGIKRRTFATVGVTDILVHPLDSSKMEFAVQFSDDDEEALRCVEKMVERFEVIGQRVVQDEQSWFLNRDPYAA